MPTLLPVLRQRFFDSDGNPLAGGKLYSYLAGTTTPAATLADSSGSVSNANPVILDANGEADVWLGSGTYKFALYDSNDALQWTVDNVIANAPTSSTIMSEVWVEHAVTDGQAATNLTGETVNSASYLSAVYDYEIARGTTVFSTGTLSMHYRDSSWRLVVGTDNRDDDSAAHGVTFSISGTTTGQLRAALDSGAGNGTIKLKRTLIPA